MKLFLLIAAIVFLAEMGDKTQIGLFSLALKYKMSRVLLGAVLAFALMTLLAVALGSFLFNIIPQEIMRILAALLFIILGLFYLFSGSKAEKQNIKEGNSLLMSFFLVSTAELGDKTQLLIASLAIKYGSPILVFTASVTGLFLASLIGLAIVPFIKDKFSWLEKAAGLVLVIVGLFMFFKPG